MRWILIVLAVGMIGVCEAAPKNSLSEIKSSPTTAPATRPSSPSERYQIATDEVSRASAALENATRAVAGNTLGLPRIRQLANDVERAYVELADARENGSPQGKLDASSAYNRAKAELDRAKHAAVSADPRVAAASAALKAAQKERLDAKTALDAYAAEQEVSAKQAANMERAKKMQDPKYAAAANGRLLVGMTKDQVLVSFQARGDIAYDTSEDQMLIGGKSVTIETWTSQAYYPGYFSRLRFENGILVSIVIH